MSNLLPAADREAVWRLYRSRRRLVRSLVASAALAMVGALVLAAWLWIHSERLALELMAAGSTAEVAGLPGAAAVTRLNSRSGRLAASSAVAPAETLLAVVKLRPAGLTLDRFEFSLLKSKPNLLLAGVASERESLLGFIEALKASPVVAEVESPISNLVKVRDLPFELVLTLR